MFSVKEIFDLAVKLEENGERFYQSAMSKTSDTRLRAVFKWLADEEIKHKEWFLRSRDNLAPGKGDPLLQEAERALLSGIVGNQTFSLEDADLSELHRAEDLINLAREFEKDTILFFEMIRSIVPDPDTLKHLDEIIAEEHRHIQFLDEYEGK